MAAVAPTFAIAPPEATGIREAAAERQRTTSARFGENPTPSAARRRVLPKARDDQQPTSSNQATIASRGLPDVCSAARRARLARPGRLAVNGRRTGGLPATGGAQAPRPKGGTRGAGMRDAGEGG